MMMRERCRYLGGPVGGDQFISDPGVSMSGLTTVYVLVNDDGEFLAMFKDPGLPDNAPHGATMARYDAVIAPDGCPSRDDDGWLVYHFVEE